MQIKIGETTYEVGALTKLSLLDVMKVDSELRPFGKTFSDIEALASLPQAELEGHPDVLWLMAGIVWATRRLAGEKVTFEEAIDVPLEDISYVGDDEPAEGAAEEVAPDPTAAASGQDAAPAPTDIETTPAT